MYYVCRAECAAARKPLYPVRAEHAFPPTRAVYTPRAESHGVDTHSSFCLKPSRGSGVAFGSRAPYGAGRLRRRPRFARQSLASLGLVELRTWLSSAIAYPLCREVRMAGQAGQAEAPGTAVSSPGTLSKNYGRFVSKWLHLDTFVSGSRSSHS